MFTNVLLVGCGGFIGSVLRFLTSVACRSYFPTSWPLSTFIANLAGCFVIGFIFPMLRSSDPNTEAVKLFVMMGVLGGFTTFSSFGLETLQLWQNGQTTTAALYMILSVALGLACVAIGYTLAGGRL